MVGILELFLVATDQRQTVHLDSDVRKADWSATDTNADAYAFRPGAGATNPKSGLRVGSEGAGRRRPSRSAALAKDR
ncbi:MAG: hypothetical protein RL019_1227 [Pseudomonadota bacterium]